MYGYILYVAWTDPLSFIGIALGSWISTSVICWDCELCPMSVEREDNFRQWRLILIVGLVMRHIVGVYFITAIMIITYIARRADSCITQLWEGSLAVTLPHFSIWVIVHISNQAGNRTQQGQGANWWGSGECEGMQRAAGDRTYETEEGGEWPDLWFIQDE